MMLLSLHNLAKTYKMLPSEALARATTFDFFVLDTFHRYSNYQEAKERGKAVPFDSRSISEQEMRARIAKTRSPETLSRFKPGSLKDRR